MVDYFVMAEGETYGPAGEEELCHWAAQGRVMPETVIWCPRTDRAMRAENWPFLASFVSSAPGRLLEYQGALPAKAGEHRLRSFPISLMVLLHYLTFGIFPLIWFNLMHDQLPRRRVDDPSAGKGIGFMFIPLFNLYWMFFTSVRLCRRIAEQRRLDGLMEDSREDMAIITCLFFALSVLCGLWAMFDPYAPLYMGAGGLVVDWLMVAPIFFLSLQASVNELVARRVLLMILSQPIAEIVEGFGDIGEDPAGGFGDEGAGHGGAGPDDVDLLA